MASASFGNDLADSVKKQLECPVCLNLCVKPIFMCANGHNVCSPCQPQLDKCPVCRIPGRPSIRNRFAEELAQSAMVPCQNADKGCEERVKAKYMDSHLEQCEFNLKCLFESCRWHGSVVNLADHARNVHAENYIVITENGVVLKINYVKMDAAMQALADFTFALPSREPRTFDVGFSLFHPFVTHPSTSAAKASNGKAERSRFSTSMLAFKNHIFWFHTEVVGKSSFNVQLHLIGATGSTSAGPAFSYELEFLSGDGACLIYKNKVRPLKRNASSDKVFVEGLAWLDSGLASGMLYRIKLFEGAFRRDRLPTNDVRENGFQSSYSRPENWNGTSPNIFESCKMQ